MRKLATIFFCLLLPACLQQYPDLRPAHTLTAGGNAFIYYQPVSEATSGLSITLEALSVRRDDGVLFPLVPRFTELGAPKNRHERLLAFGSVPPGRYDAISLGVARATLRGGGGEAELLVADDIVSIELPFTVHPAGAVVISLQLDAKASVQDGFRFTPSFSATLPSRLAAGLIGLVTNAGSNTVTVFNKLSGQVVAVIPTGEEPFGVVLDESRDRGYVAISGDDEVLEIDLLEQRVRDRIKLNGYDRPTELALTPDGRTLLAVNTASSSVSLIEIATLFEDGRVSVGNGPESILIDQTGRRAYAFNTLSNSITAFSIPAQAPVGTIITEPEPLRGELNGAGDRMFVIHRSSPYLTVIDPQSLSILNRIYVGTEATALKVDPRTDMIYLARRDTGTIDIYDPFSLLPVSTIQAAGEVGYIAIDGEGDRIYLTLPDSNQIQVIQLVSLKTMAMIDVGEAPGRVVLMGGR